jgi:hypothetical protein
MIFDKLDINDPEIISKLKEYTDKYNNPDNSDEISIKIRNTPTIGGVKKLVDEVFPDWFVTTLDSYSIDYPYLQSNWIKCCDKIGCPTAQIMIVQETELGDNHTLIREFAECFSSAGFSVRRQMEFIPCSVCIAALPSIMMYDYMKENQMKVVDSGWADKCVNC